MEKKMSVMGIGHKAGAVILLYLVVVFGLGRIFSPFFRITGTHYNTLLITGIILIVVGFATNLAAAFTMLKAHKNGKLATKGLYAVFLNPMYTLQLFITVPGLTLLFNSWIVLTTIIAAIITIKVFVKEEEKYLENTFGDEYREYRKRVLIKF
ncbi:MAG: isoprenylcysteine carboxylmethyltransferase family protein [Bacillota bacterium]|nr:isoprenylcysteine carboxylmethyltransferase family protein [Bacillota bacterium]